MLAVQYIQKGVVYKVRNRKTNFYLTAGPEVTASPLHIGKITQLWLFDEIKPNIYEIVSLQTGQVITRKQSLVIDKGNWSANQFWKLQRAQMNSRQNYFWIIANDDQSQYLFGSSASSKVSMKNFDLTLFVSNWELQQVDLQKDLSGCCVLRSDFSNMVIDVPEGSNKDGISIIQYHYNGRGNQRWLLEKYQNSYIIRNLCSGLILCPQGKSVKSGAKIIQTQLMNKIEQSWTIEKLKQNKFFVRSKADQSLYLGVGSTKQSANIQLVVQKQKALWTFQGSYLILLS